MRDVARMRVELLLAKLPGALVLESCHRSYLVGGLEHVFHLLGMS